MKISRMHISILISLVMVVIAISTQAQVNEPISGVWEGRLGNHQTADLPGKESTSIFIVHYFDRMGENGIHDLYGIFGTANLQMGVEYGLGKNFSAFFLTEKFAKTQELGFRYQLVQQNLNGQSLVSMALAFSISADARDRKFFGDNYYFINRFFYTTQLAVSRQFSQRWKLMSNTTFVHFNIVPENSYSDFLSENISIAWKLNTKTALFSSLDFPLGIASAAEGSPQKPKSIYSIGTILGSAVHNFQVFLSNGSQISLGKEFLNNHTGFSLKDMRIGFNIHIKLGR